MRVSSSFFFLYSFFTVSSSFFGVREGLCKAISFQRMELGCLSRLVRSISSSLFLFFPPPFLASSVRHHHIIILLLFRNLCREFTVLPLDPSPFRPISRPSASASSSSVLVLTVTQLSSPCSSCICCILPYFLSCSRLLSRITRFLGSLLLETSVHCLLLSPFLDTAW